jgi:hypothetical protein
MAICPNCDSTITAVELEHLAGNSEGRRPLKCIGYTCPDCSVLLGVQIDPVALHADTIRRLTREVKAIPRQG